MIAPAVLMDNLRLEQSQRYGQLIATTTHLVNNKVQFAFQVLQLLPHGAA